MVVNNRGRDPTITAFIQHGFIKKGDSGTQAYGTCPFCGHLEHKHTATMYINRKTLAWDCKSCGKNGGFKSWLHEISAMCQPLFKGEAAIWLSKNRGLKISTLRNAQFGYNPITGNYCFPVMDALGEKIWDLRIYDKKKIRSTAGCTVGLYGWDGFKNYKGSKVWICEGEWDGFAWREIFQELQIPELIVSSPGAGTFKAEWTIFFKEKDAIALYDYDNAGREGSVKIYNSIKSETKTLLFLQWPQDEGYIENWDLRDQYTKKGLGAQGTFDFVTTHLSDIPPGVESEGSIVGGKTLAQEEKFTGNGLSHEEVYRVYTKWLELKSTDIIDVLFGTIFANRLPGVPLWMFLVGPSGSAKSVFLMSLSKSPRITTTTTLTVPALISGANVGGGVDPSLLAIMHERILVVKDYTTILTMNSLYRDEIFGLLRDAYDGKIEKRFGNGVRRVYDPCKFGIIAGVTDMIELFTEEHSALGERYLRYPVYFPQDLNEQKVIIKKALQNTIRAVEMGNELSETAKEATNVDITTIPVIPDEMLDRMVTLAQWTAVLRSSIIRNKYSREITHAPMTELATRIAEEYEKLLMGIGMFKRLDQVTYDEYAVIKNTAIKTVPSRLELILRKCYLMNPTIERGITTITKLMKLPSITCQMVMENLCILGVFERLEYIRSEPKYRISDQWIQMIEDSQVYSNKTIL